MRKFSVTFLMTIDEDNNILSSYEDNHEEDVHDLLKDVMYDVDDVDAEDKENAEEFANEEEVTEDEIEIKVDGDYEIEVEKEDDEEEESEEAPAEEEAAEESVTNEAEVKSDEEFQEYAFSVLQQAFGDKFDEEKAKEVVDGLLGKHGDDYGAAVGALQSSLG